MVPIFLSNKRLLKLNVTGYSVSKALLTEKPRCLLQQPHSINASLEKIFIMVQHEIEFPVVC